MLQNAYLDAKIGFDTEENEPPKVWGELFFKGEKRKKKKKKKREKNLKKEKKNYSFASLPQP